MKLDFNKKIEFKTNIDWHGNILKTTLGGNIFAMSGLLFFILYPAVFFVLIYVRPETGTDFIIIFIDIFLGYINYLIIIISIIKFLEEFRKKCRLKNTFFKTNKIYSFFFYIGILLNCLFFVLITCFLLNKTVFSSLINFIYFSFKSIFF